MTLYIVRLILSLGIILLACELFTNSIEWLGKKLKVGDGVVGSLFSAVGTCLPETMIPIIAIVSANGNDNAADICIGAIVGAPFMLGTLALFVTGMSAMVFWKRRKTGIKMIVNTNVIQRDMAFFMSIYSVGILAAFLPQGAARYAIAFFLIVSYVYYIVQTVKNDNVSSGKIEELYFAKLLGHKRINAINTSTGTIAMITQLLISLGAIVLGAEIFVKNIEGIATTLGIPVLILSLIIAPIATELPEKFNSIIWVSRRKDTLALGNITGAMVFQSCIPVSFGIISTPWALSGKAFISALLVLFCTFIIYIRIKYTKQLSAMMLILGGLFYFTFIILVVKGII